MAEVHFIGCYRQFCVGKEMDGGCFSARDAELFDTVGYGTPQVESRQRERYFRYIVEGEVS
jgi:hypothetical protein